MAENKLFDPNNSAHVVSVGGRKFITFVGLQARAVDLGWQVVGNESEIVQNGDEHESGRWIVKVKMTFMNVEGKYNAVIEAIGDSNKENTGKMVQPHMPRMAETRGQVRAFRIITRSPYTAREELGDG